MRKYSIYDTIDIMQNDPKPIVGAIVLAGAMIAGAILLRGSSSPVMLPSGQAVPEIREVSKQEHIWGNPDAKILIVEYSDLECPFCKRFHATMLQLTEARDDVAWVYRHYPLLELHPKAFKEALATECAADQGGNTAFWNYTNRLFEITPANNGLEESELPKIAEYVGLDVNAFNECLASEKFAEKVQADMKDGDIAGVRGTPFSLILKRGKVVDSIPGALPYEDLIKKLDAIK